MEDRLRRLETHVKNHPTDYQSVISLLKLRSAFIEKQRKQKQIERLRKVAAYRKMLKEGNNGKYSK